jgi:hypothetical protein
MRDDSEARLSEAEAAALAALRVPATPPEPLEQRVVDALALRAAAHPRRTKLGSIGRPLLATAAAVIIFLAGRATRERGLAPELRAEEAQFMILLFEDVAYAQPEPGEEGARAAEYGAWAGDLTARGIRIEGDELLPGGVTLTGAGAGASLEPGVPGTPAGRFAGYLIMVGSDMAQAIGIARETPHLRYGGRVAVIPLAGH